MIFARQPLPSAGAAPIFAALGDPSRLALIERLCARGPAATAALGEGIPVSRQGLTKHLQLLESAGLVDSARVGRDRQWRVRTERIAEVRGYLDHVSAQWDARIARLKPLVETPDP